MANSKITKLLGDKAEYLLNHTSNTVEKSTLHLPGPDHIDRIWKESNRSNQVLRSMQQLLGNGRLANTGYCSIFPVDQGIEHSAGASFAPNPIYFDPENIIKLAIEAGCNGVASTFGVLGIMSRKYAHKIPFIVKINHNEFLSYPNTFDQTMFGTVKSAWNMGAVGVGATIYWGSEESRKQLKEVSEAFELAHELGLMTILWCYTRNNAFKVNGIDYHTSADFTGQANHLGVTIQADIIKQKLPTNNGGYLATKHGKTSPLVYEKLTSDHPVDLCRYQVLNCYSGRVGLINSGGESKGQSDLADAVETAIINKRAGGMGLILGRKAFQRPMKEGIDMLGQIIDVYLDESITIA
ncbi:MAG: class I fructose-bisphosphate aldolase [Parafilimonas sp.]